MLGNLIFVSLMEAVLLPLYLALFNLPFVPLLLPVVFLGTLGFAAVGTLVSAMTVHARSREVLLPVLLFPLIMPALIASVKLTAAVLDAQAWPEVRHWLQLLVGFDAVFLVISYVAFDYVVEE
jgi:heme exporter protein B